MNAEKRFGSVKIMYYRATTKERKRKINAIRILMLGLTLLCILFLVDRKVRPIIKNNAAIQAKMIATKALNQAITEQLRDKDYTYDTMVKLGKDNDGQIISMETNTAQINEIQAQLTENAIRQLETIEDTVYKIRFGTLLHSEYFAGKGVQLKFHLQPAGYVTTKILSSFTEAGINQTRHEIKFRITVPIAVAATGYHTSTDVGIDFVLADTLIVGEVPQYYTNVITEDKNLVNELNDYKAETPKE
ncbi:MAG: sporulation protein YunB [Clostridiales bacterium]|nr:sporulation protein YunB [Clostridiales bacterium]